MNAKTTGWVTGLTMAMAASLMAPSAMAKEDFKLVAAVPDDVFLCVAGRHNAEREFLDNYWSEVIDALKQSGIGSDLMELIGSQLGDEERAEVDRLKERASQLIDGIDWKALGRGEFLFAERLGKPLRFGDNVSMGPPDMVWLMRGKLESTPKNYDGLVAVLQTIVEEVNKAAGEQVLTVDSAPRLGAKVASVNLMKISPKEPPFSLAVALHGEVIVITFGNEMLADVLGLLEGKSSKKSLTADPRFKQAFAKLPAAEDALTFFDMQSMLKTFRALADEAVGAIKAESGDTIANAHFNQEADKLADQGVGAYQQNDYKQALEFTKQAHDLAPTDSRIMYNLACFHALVGNKNEALAWLEKSVEGGFYAPKQISNDSDLTSLRGDPRYEAALAKATAKAVSEGGAVAEAAMWKRLADRIIDVPGMIDYIASVEYTDGYRVYGEEVTALTPGAPEQPFYQVFGKHAPLTSFDRYLPQETVSFSVGNGIDLDALYKFVEDTIRGMGSKGEEILAQWAGMQAQFEVDVRKDVLGWIQGNSVTATIKQPAGNQWVFMLKVTDEDAARQKLASALEFLSTNLQKAAQQNPMLGMLALRTSPATHERLSGFHNVAIGMNPQPGVCGVADGHLILGSSADAAAICLATAAGEHPNIRKNAQLMAEALIPDGPFRSISFTDKRNLGPETAQVIGALSMAGGMAAMMVPDPQAQQALAKILGIVAKLGPVAQRIDFYKSSADYTTFDGKAWRVRSVTNYRSPAERGSTHGEG